MYSAPRPDAPGSRLVTPVSATCAYLLDFRAECRSFAFEGWPYLTSHLVGAVHLSCTVPPWRVHKSSPPLTRDVLPLTTTNNKMKMTRLMKPQQVQRSSVSLRLVERFEATSLRFHYRTTFVASTFHREQIIRLQVYILVVISQDGMQPR